MVTSEVSLEKVVSAPMARNNNAEGKRGDNTSAVSSEDLLEEVNHVRFRLRFAYDRCVTFSGDSILCLPAHFLQLLFVGLVLPQVVEVWDFLEDRA